MAFRCIQLARVLSRAAELRKPSSSPFPYLCGSARSHSSGISNVVEAGVWRLSSLHKTERAPHLFYRTTLILRSKMAAEPSVFGNEKRSAATQARAPAQARQMGAVKVSISSPGFIYEPYAPRPAISFLKRWFTRGGWRRTKDDIILELKSAYAIAKLRKSGYSKQKFYLEAVNMYKEINTLMANGDKKSLRRSVTENMFSTLKNEIKQRESMWSRVYWELIEPIVKIRTLRARLESIGVDRNDLNKVFIQLTLEFLSKQKFEAYDSNGAVVSGDKNKENLVKAAEHLVKAAEHLDDSVLQEKQESEQ